MELTHTNHAVGQSAYHFVWRPKYNLKIFVNPTVRYIADNAIRTVAEKWKIRIYELKVMKDHVHCFAEVPKTMSVSFALQVLKGGSARIILKSCSTWRKCLSVGHKKVHLWSPGKFFRSVGCVSGDVIENYIKTSQDEWVYEIQS